MSRRAAFSILLLGAAALATTVALNLSRDALQPRPGLGLVVEKVDVGSVAEEAGVKAGDILLTWERAAVRGEPAVRAPLRSTFDLDMVANEASRAAVRLSGLRLGKPLSWRMDEGQWGIDARPVMPPSWEAAYEAGRRRLEGGDAGRGLAAWHRTAEAAAEAGDPALAAWLWLHTARTAMEQQRWDLADRALAPASRLPRPPPLRARVRAGEAEAFDRRGDLPRAETAWIAALRGAPPGLMAASDLDALGWVLLRRGDMDRAEKAFRRSLALRLRFAPDSLFLAASYNKLGILHAERGELAASEEMFRRVVTLWESRDPESLAAAAGLENLGLVTSYRGDLATASDLFRRAATLKERLAPGSEHVARSLLNQGLVQWRRGDLESAHDLLTDSLTLWRKLAPKSRDVASALTNLGLVAFDRGQLGLAERRFRQALTLLQEIEPGTTSCAEALNNLALVAHMRGDGARAETLLRQALAITGEVAPEGLEASQYLQNLGELAEDRGDLRTAESLMRRALAIRLRLAPGTDLEAWSWYGLGRLHRRAGRLDEARETWMRGVAAVEGQEEKVGGSEETRSVWKARYTDLYRDLLDLLLEMGKNEEAFQLLERQRARRLLALLAERDLLWQRDLPADLARERTRLAAEYDRTQAALGRLAAGGGDEVTRLESRLRELRNRRAELADAILRASPRLASLHYPRPVDAAAARAALDPGTVLLAYAVGPRESHLFILEGGAPRPGPGFAAFRAAGEPLQVFTIPRGEDDMKERVLAFRYLLQRPVAGARSRAALEERGRSLAADLIAPAVPWIARADRVLIVADGPLHALPFGALPVAGRPGASRFLVEWRPLHTAASATVYAELRKRRRPHRLVAGPAPAGLVVFGDPRNPRDLDGRPLPPLPATRAESRALERLFPGARVFLGRDATEEALKAAGRSARYLHVASHAVADEHLPLDSFLALSAPRLPRSGQDNGRLQAWEVFEQLRLDADLVTLSSCGTGTGQAPAGEGVLSLARAFQYAGARSVVASLWDIPDRSTALLMQRFYAGLARGLDKDEALRRAQLALRRRPETSHPFHWAAHQLVGDWR